MRAGNTYRLPDGTGGLVDWQLSVRGFGCRHERALLAYYLDALRASGVRTAPDADAAFLEYRRAAVWGVYIGWLTTPIENYGWDVTVMNHIRLLTAYRDLETAAAIADLP